MSPRTAFSLWRRFFPSENWTVSGGAFTCSTGFHCYSPWEDCMIDKCKSTDTNRTRRTSTGLCPTSLVNNFILQLEIQWFLNLSIRSNIQIMLDNGCVCNLWWTSASYNLVLWQNGLGKWVKQRHQAFLYSSLVLTKCDLNRANVFI